MTTRRSRIAILGDGHMATEAMRIVSRHPALQPIAIAFHDNQDLWSSKLNREARALGCVDLPSHNFNDAETVARLRDLGPDLILSVNNFDIIKTELLELPPDGIFNFHNGPLPEYRGVNIPSWAIINGETSHAISWILVDEGTDTGPVVLRAEVTIDEGETAISLIAKCIAKAIGTLPELLNRYAAGSIHPERQTGPIRYYSLRDTPNDGRIDLTWSCARISALVRGLTFHPYPNLFVTPKISIDGAWVIVGCADFVGEKVSTDAGNVGHITDITNDGVTAAVADGYVRFSHLTDEDGKELSADELIKRTSLKYGT